MSDDADLLILGSGSTAFAAALRAQELGKRAILIEERVVGGTCANRGCLPSKNLIEAARLVHDAAHPRYPGLRPARLGVDFGALVAQKDELVVAYRGKKYESLAGGAFRVERGHARFVDAHTIDVEGRRLRAPKILIATGSRPVLPPIAGLAEVPYLTSDLLAEGEAGALRALPPSIAIVGAGYIALELGQMLRRLGAEVTILARGPALLGHGYEPEVGPALAAILADEGIEVRTNATARAARREGSEVVLQLASGELRAAALIVATGRRPNSDGLELARAGVAVGEDGAICVDAELRTSVPHIFAAGDVIGGETGSQLATPVGSQDGGIAAHNALAGEPPRRVDHRVIPRAMFTDPPLATVGITERDVAASGRRCWCKTVPLTLVPRAGAVRDTRGFVKMVADADTDEVLGVTMLGQSAAEVIHEAAMGLRFRAKLRDFIELLHVYPTMAEALKIAAISRYKDPARLSCCAE